MSKHHVFFLQMGGGWAHLKGYIFVEKQSNPAPKEKIEGETLKR